MTDGATRAKSGVTPRRRPRGELDQAAFECLLRALDTDRNLAGERYETIRAKNITIFAARESRWPDRLVDEALDRTALKIQGGERIEDIAAYVYTVAGYVLREEWRTAEARTDSIESVGEIAHDQSYDPAAELRQECLDRCHDTLTPEDRELMDEYYQGQKSQRIEGRKKLSKRLGVSLAALRQRAFRVRKQLLSCVEECLGASGSFEGV